MCGVVGIRTMGHIQHMIAQAAAAVVLFALGACSTTDKDERAARHLNILYDKYLLSDVAAAREALREALCLLQNAKDLRPQGRAQGLCLGYARLYALEHYSGDADAAASAFREASRWYVENRRLAGTLEPGAGLARSGFTEGRCRRMVADWDCRALHERGLPRDVPAWQRSVIPTMAVPQRNDDGATR